MYSFCPRYPQPRSSSNNSSSKQNTNNNKNNNIIIYIYTFCKGINRENNKDHISQSRGSALDDEKPWRMEDCTRGSSLVNHEVWLQTLWAEDA